MAVVGRKWPRRPGLLSATGATPAPKPHSPHRSCTQPGKARATLLYLPRSMARMVRAPVAVVVVVLVQAPWGDGGESMAPLTLPQPPRRHGFFWPGAIYV